MDTIDYTIVFLIILLTIYLMYLKCDIDISMDEHFLIFILSFILFGVIYLILDYTVTKEYLDNNEMENPFEISQPSVGQKQEIRIDEPDIEEEENYTLDVTTGKVVKDKVNSLNVDEPVKDKSKQYDEVEYDVSEIMKCGEGPRKNTNYGYSFMPPCEWGYVAKKIEKETECNICPKVNRYSSDYLVLEPNFYNDVYLPPKQDNN